MEESVFRMAHCDEQDIIFLKKTGKTAVIRRIA
jgi:hypothetical protein